MSKLTKQDKIDIYNYWKNYGKSSIWLSNRYGVNSSNISYMLNLIDRYSIKILDKSYTSYTVEFKEKAIKRVLVNNEIVQHVALDLALPTHSLIHNWIRKYKEDGYNVINHKKGRPSREKQRPTNKKLQKQVKGLKQENLKLTVENEFVKKLSALVSQRKNQKQRNSSGGY